jgi:dihydrofolate reductase
MGDAEEDDTAAGAAVDPADLSIRHVVAVAENGVIGRDGGLPWHYPEDLAHFKAKTMGHPVLMGRRTYESLPDGARPLPGRTNVVLSTSNPDVPEDVTVVETLADAWVAVAEEDDTVSVIGGQTVFEGTFDVTDRLFVTEIHEAYEGDTYYEFDRERWREVSRDDREDLSFVEYERRE